MYTLGVCDVSLWVSVLGVGVGLDPREQCSCHGSVPRAAYQLADQWM